LKQGSAGALNNATLPKLRDVRAQRTSEEGHTTKAGGSPAANAPADPDGTAASSSGVGVNKNKLMSASQRETFSALTSSARAAAEDLVGKEEAQSILEPIAANQSPLKLSGDITNASIGGGRKLQESCPDGSGLTVTYTVTGGGQMAGCFVELELSAANSHPEYFSGHGLIVASESETDPTTVNTVFKDEGYIFDVCFFNFIALLWALKNPTT